MAKILFSLLILILPAIAWAQPSSTWKVHPYFVANKLQNNIDTGDKVYYLVSNTVYCYDKTSGVTETLNNSNLLNDISVVNMYYNDVKNYVMLVYDNSNIDIILADGRVINIPEIKDAVITQTKAINHVTFDNEHSYIATDFGFVVLDNDKFIIKESHIYGVKFTSIARVGDKLVACNGSDSGVRYCDINSNREKIAAFKAFSPSLYLIDAEVTPIDDTNFFINSKTSVDVYTVNDASQSHTAIAANRATTIQRTPTGFIANFPSANFYVTTDEHGNNSTKNSCVNELLSCNPNSDGTMWSLSSNGLDKRGEGNPHKPNGIGIETTAFWTTFNPGDGKTYLSSTTDNGVLTSANKGAKTEIWAYDGKDWENVTPANFPIFYKGEGYQGNYWLNFIPGTENAYVVASRAAGVAHVVNGTVANTYVSGSNMPLNDKYKPATAIDKDGNLWLAQSYQTSNKTVAVLPKDKLDNPTKVTKADWYLFNVPNMEVGNFKGSSFAISKKTDIKVYCSGGFQKQVVMWDSKGDITKMPDSRSFTQFRCTDGKAFSSDYIYCLYAASNGDVWMGTNSGIISFNPADAFNGELLAVHMQVESEDGQSEEYLLDGIQVNCITEDSVGRMLLGTRSNGLYIVNNNGSKILNHFDTSNSILPSNCIYNISYNPITKSALIVTMNGVVEYFLDATSSASDYSNVNVYPNPVKPDYTGYVTISGLMDDSHVSIVAPDGTVVKELTSTGDTCAWDCADATGERVASGLYTVKAAQGNGEQAPIATFLILK